MHLQSNLAWVAIFALQGILVLLWTMPCGILGLKGEKAGIGFWKTFLISFFMTPIAGPITLSISRPAHSHRTIANRSIRNSAGASARISS